MEKYEKTMLPLLNEREHEKLKELIENFSGKNKIGEKLQLYLLEKQRKMDNWAYTYWLDDLYLNNPAALPINSNPGMVFPNEKFTTIVDLAKLAAKLLDETLSQKKILKNKKLPIEKATSREPGQPLCMAQYNRILGSCRIPGEEKDTQKNWENNINEDDTNEYVIVICRGQFYCIILEGNDRGKLTQSEICSQLIYILNDAPNLKNIKKIGLLTTLKRPNWHSIRTKLLSNEQNKRNFELIENSLLILCLDENLPENFNKKNDTKNLHHMIHGGGSKYNTYNRYFDKTVQLILTGDGSVGFNYEHSQAEGVTVINLIEKIWFDSNYEEIQLENSDYLPPPEKLEWILDKTDMKNIEEAAYFIDNLINDLDLFVYKYENYGKNFIKNCKISPDVYVQLALQLTYYKLYGKFTATYESASTRRFLRGRVDCIRSAHVEALNWVKSMTEKLHEDKKVTFNLISNEEKLKLFNLAIRKQTEEMIDNILGNGMDIHLLGLREAFKETSPHNSVPSPEIFTNFSYKLSNKFLLSTSQVSTNNDNFMGYGPVEPDGYGVSYNIKNDTIIFCISSFWSSDVTSSTKFQQKLEESLNTMKELLIKTPPTSSI